VPWCCATLTCTAAACRVSWKCFFGLREFLAATYIVGLVKITVITTLLTGLAAGLYHFHLFDLGLSLIPFFANLLLMGWAIGMATTSLILRWGQAAEALAWGVPFFIQPFAAVFYPVEVLPRFLQPISLAIPATHVFEGMRQVLRGEGLDTGSLVAAFGLNVVYLVAAGLLFSYTFNLARKRGLLAKLVTQ
jgi:ABC-2 type transport system permease protein